VASRRIITLHIQGSPGATRFNALRA